PPECGVPWPHCLLRRRAPCTHAVPALVLSPRGDTAGQSPHGPGRGTGRLPTAAPCGLPVLLLRVPSSRLYNTSAYYHNCMHIVNEVLACQYSSIMELN